MPKAKNPKKKEDKIYSILKSIDDTLKAQNSYRRIFAQGLIRGFGTALGATVLVALMTSVTIQLIDSLDWHTFTQYFMNDAINE